MGRAGWARNLLPMLRVPRPSGPRCAVRLFSVQARQSGSSPANRVAPRTSLDSSQMQREHHRRLPPLWPLGRQALPCIVVAMCWTVHGRRITRSETHPVHAPPQGVRDPGASISLVACIEHDRLVGHRESSARAGCAADRPANLVVMVVCCFALFFQQGKNGSRSCTWHWNQTGRKRRCRVTSRLWFPGSLGSGRPRMRPHKAQTLRGMRGSPGGFQLSRPAGGGAQSPPCDFIAIVFVSVM